MAGNYGSYQEMFGIKINGPINDPGLDQRSHKKSSDMCTKLLSKHTT